MKGRSSVLADVVDGANVRMIQRGSRPGLRSQPLNRLRVLAEFVGYELQRDLAAQAGVLAGVDHTHPARAQLARDAIVRNCPPEHVLPYGNRVEIIRQRWLEQRSTMRAPPRSALNSV